MEDSYRLGPIAVSKSFVRHPFFWPVVGVAAITIAGLSAHKAGYLNFDTKPPVPTISAQVFPLDKRLSKSLLFTSGTDIYRTDGHSEEKLFLVGSEVLSLVPSRDGSRLAATYKTPNGGSNVAGYPYSTLIMYDMNTKRSLPLIAQNNTTVRYPMWSDDGRYLSFWINEGEESFVYDVGRRKAIYSVKREGSTSVSPVLFLPNTSGILYVKNSTLFSAAVDGTRPISLAESVASTKSIPGSSTPVRSLTLSPNGTNVAYYALNGDATITNTATRESKMIAAKATILGFLSDDTLLYSVTPTDTKDTPTVYTYSIADATSKQLRNNQSFLGKGLLPESTVVTPQTQFFASSIYPDVGPQLLAKDGIINKDCSLANFRYSYNIFNDTRTPQTLEVVSPDGAYLLGTSGGSLAVLDTDTCQPYVISGTKPGITTWMP